jgi:hypothetical protein
MTLESGMYALRTSSWTADKKVSFRSFDTNIFSNQAHVNYFNTSILDTAYLNIRQTVANESSSTEFYTLINEVTISGGGMLQINITTYTDVTKTTQNFFSLSKIEYYLPALITSWAKENGTISYTTQFKWFRDSVRGDKVPSWNFYTKKAVSGSANNLFQLAPADFYHNYVVEPAWYIISPIGDSTYKLTHSSRYSTNYQAWWFGDRVNTYSLTKSTDSVLVVNINPADYGTGWIFVPTYQILTSRDEKRKYYYIINKHNQALWADSGDGYYLKRTVDSLSTSDLTEDPYYYGTRFRDLYHGELNRYGENSARYNISDFTPNPNGNHNNVRAFLWEITRGDNIEEITIKSCYGYYNSSNNKCNNPTAETFKITKYDTIGYEYDNLV